MCVCVCLEGPAPGSVWLMSYSSKNSVYLGEVGVAKEKGKSATWNFDTFSAVHSTLPIAIGL